LKTIPSDGDVQRQKSSRARVVKTSAHSGPCQPILTCKRPAVRKYNFVEVSHTRPILSSSVGNSTVSILSSFNGGTFWIQGLMKVRKGIIDDQREERPWKSLFHIFGNYLLLKSRKGLDYIFCIDPTSDNNTEILRSIETFMEVSDRLDICKRTMM
jgi:hypothetical protein